MFALSSFHPFKTSVSVVAHTVLCLMMSLAVFAATGIDAAAQTNEWTWVGGRDTAGGVYGTLGVPSAGNIPPARGETVTWTDKAGNFWLFGGADSFSLNGSYNDLWEYSSATNEWTWMGGSSGGGSLYGVYGTQGVPAAENIPGARALATSWIDKNGNFWLFGGSGYNGDPRGNGGPLDDMWEYSRVTNEWTWIGGSNTLNQPAVYGTRGIADAGNTPGARLGASSWTDKNGNFWLFGGFDLNNAVWLNDMWEYNSATNEWTWVAGSNLPSAVGKYGTLGTPSADTAPGARWVSTTWNDSSGNLWLLGGANTIFITARPTFNDLWKFDPSTGLWTWESGSIAQNQPAVYGTLGVASPTTTPGALVGGFSWTDSNDNLWLFGGEGLDSAGQVGPLNALMEFNPSTNQWTWMGGSTSNGASGVYGTLGSPAAGNIPGGRFFGASWADKSGNLWLFGGIGIETTQEIGPLNDLWKYQPPSASSGVPLPTSTALTASSYPALSDEPVTFTATVSATTGTAVPPGSVQFNINGAALGSPVTLDASGVATATSVLPVGYLSITATYTPASNVSFTASTSAVFTEAVYSSPRQSDSVSFTSAVQTLGSGFNHPYGVAVDANENVYVADSGNSAVKELLATGGYTTINTLGSGFSYPTGIAIDATGNLFVADPSNNTVYKLLPAGGYATVNNLGRGFDSPYGVAVDANDNVYVADTGHGSIREMSPCGSCGGGYGAASTLGGGFQFPWGVAVDSSANVFVTDIGNHTINELLSASNYATVNTVGSGFFSNPYGVAVGSNGDLLVTDTTYGTAREMSEVDGFTTVSTPASGLNAPIGVAVDASGNLFVADTFNNDVREISPAGGNFNAQKVGSKSAVISMYFSFAAPTTLGSTGVLAQQGGAASSDFADAGTGSCKAGGTYAANSNCTIDVTFTPTQTGLRNGVVELLDGSGNVLAIGSLQGSGSN